MSKLKKTPKFNSVAEERTFWETHDSSEYVDWTKAKPATFVNLTPSAKATTAVTNAKKQKLQMNNQLMSEQIII